MRQAKNRPKKTFLVDEEDFETIDYTTEPQENLFSSESILAKANEVFDFERFTKEQAEALDKIKREKIDEEILQMRAFWLLRMFLILKSSKNSKKTQLENLKNNN